MLVRGVGLRVDFASPPLAAHTSSYTPRHTHHLKVCFDQYLDHVRLRGQDRRGVFPLHWVFRGPHLGWKLFRTEVVRSTEIL